MYNDLYNLEETDKLKKAIAAPLKLQQQKNRNVDISKYITILQLHTFPSSQRCRDDIIQFAKNPLSHLLVTVVDMSVCSAAMINMAMDAIDSNIRGDQSTVVILHLPPEMNLVQSPCYNAIFLNGWEYIYIDSLGLLSDLESSTTIGVDENQQQASPSSVSPPSLEVDPRTWIAKAFGVDIPLDEDSICIGFRSLFFSILEQVCHEMIGVSSNQQLGHPQATMFYSFKAKRYPILKQLFVDHPQWYEHLIRSFSRNWTSSVLSGVVSDASNAILIGRAVGSFLVCF